MIQMTEQELRNIATIATGGKDVSKKEWCYLVGKEAFMMLMNSPHLFTVDRYGTHSDVLPNEMGKLFGFPVLLLGEGESIEFVPVLSARVLILTNQMAAHAMRLGALERELEKREDYAREQRELEESL